MNLNNANNQCGAAFTDYNTYFPGHEPVYAYGVGGGCTVYALKEGIERFFITDINNPASSAMAQSGIPILRDGLIASVHHQNNYSADQASRMVRGFNHLPGGCNVLYMDGHVQFIKFPGGFPVSHYVAIERTSAQSTPGINVNPYINHNNGKIPII